jgi:hypothetical protein
MSVPATAMKVVSTWLTLLVDHACSSINRERCHAIPPRLPDGAPNVLTPHRQVDPVRRPAATDRVRCQRLRSDDSGQEPTIRAGDPQPAFRHLTNRMASVTHLGTGRSHHNHPAAWTAGLRSTGIPTTDRRVPVP